MSIIISIIGAIIKDLTIPENLTFRKNKKDDIFSSSLIIIPMVTIKLTKLNSRLVIIKPILYKVVAKINSNNKNISINFKSFNAKDMNIPICKYIYYLELVFIFLYFAIILSEVI